MSRGINDERSNVFTNFKLQELNYNVLNFNG